MVAKETVSQIRKGLESCLGENICITSYGGRNKITSVVGTVDSTYSNLFIIKDIESQRNLSYSYSDIIMNSIEVTKAESGESLLNIDFGADERRYMRL